MVTLEQVKLLESKVVKAVEYIRKTSDENSLLKGKLSGYEKRIGELETLVQSFEENQSRIEEGFIAALERLDQVKDTIDSALNGNSGKAPEKPKPETEKAGTGAKDTSAPDLEDTPDSEDSPNLEEKSGELDIF